MFLDLSELEVGVVAQVVCISGGAHLYRQRLFAAGVRPGATCQVIQRAPLGDPLKVLLDAHEIALRADEAKIVQVEVLT